MNILSRISRGFILSLSTSFLWACVIVNSRYLLKLGENPLNLTIWMGIINLAPWLFLFRKHAKAFIHLTKKHILLLIIIGISSSIGISYLQALALANTPAANFAFLYRTIVIFTIFFAWIFFKERLTWQKLFLTLFILIGSFLLTTNGKGLVLTRGDIYTLLMAASAAFIANILVKHTVSHMHPDLSGSVTSIVSTISLVSMGLITGILAIPHNIVLIAVGAFISFFQIITRNRAYKYATASFVTMVVSITPLFVAVLSVPLLNEHLSVVEVIGGLIIVGATVFVEYLQI